MTFRGILYSIIKIFKFLLCVMDDARHNSHQNTGLASMEVIIYKVHSFTCPNYLVNIYTWMLNIYLKSELLIPYTSPIPPNHEPQTYSHCSNGTCLLTVVQAKNIGDNFNVLSFNSPHPIHQKILSSHLQNEFRTFPLLTSSTAAIMAITNLPASS